MIGGLGNNATGAGGQGLGLGLPLLENVQFSFDFSAAMAEVAGRQDARDLDVRDRDDGLGLGVDPNHRQDLKRMSRAGQDDTERTRGDRRAQRGEDRSATQRSASDHRKNSAKDVSARDSSDGGTEVSSKKQAALQEALNRSRSVQNLGTSILSLRSKRLPGAEGLMGDRGQGGKGELGGRKDLQGAHTKQAGPPGRRTFGGTLSGEPSRESSAGGAAREILRAMDPNSMEAKIKGAHESGEHKVKTQVSHGFQMQAAVDAKAAQMTQGTQSKGPETAKIVVDAVKDVAKAMAPKAISAQAPANQAVAMAEMKQDAEAGASRGEATKGKPNPGDAKARFENTMRALEKGQTTVKFVDAKLGQVEARITMNGQDLTVRLRAEESASRQAIVDVLGEIRRGIKEADLVNGKLDVSQERERQPDHSDEDGRGSSFQERDRDEREHGQPTFSLSV